ncbi:MAG: hypothetical protein U0636_01435 [Phycisphaerales bacterium]
MPVSDRPFSSLDRNRRGNTLVLVTAILVLLVILATAFLVRSQAGRAQASAQQRAQGRQDRVDTIAQGLAQDVADSLFVRSVDQSSYPAQVNANAAAGVTGWQVNMPRSDYPRLPPDPLAIRYGVDYFDALDNATLAAAAGGDGILDGFNFAAFAVKPWTNWPDVYLTVSSTVQGEGNPVGNPGFGDARWLRATEPMRALTMVQGPTPTVSVPPAPPNAQLPSAVPGNNWGNLMLVNGIPVLSPEGLGFSHWPHLSWIGTAENGYRVCYDISDIEANTIAGLPGTPAGLNALGVPYEQWLTNIPPRELTVTTKDSRGYLVMNQNDWTTRRNNWFNNYANVILNNPLEALPNFLQLGAFGDPSDEFKYQPAGSASPGAPTDRNLISRTLADADGDGFTDSFWFVAPVSSDRETRQVVAVSIIDNSALLNVNVATRFDRTTTNGQTPADLALVTRRESYDESNAAGQTAANRDTAVGFFNARENDPEYRISRRNPNSAPTANYLVYPRTANAGSPVTGVDVGWDPVRWESVRTAPAAPGATAVDTTENAFLASLGVMMQSGTPGSTARPIPIFDATTAYGLAAPGGAGYGGWFVLTRPADRLTYFKAQANGGELVDPVTTARLATLSPFGMDDEIELRAANGLNTAASISRLESVLGDATPVSVGGTASLPINAQNFLRSSRSREESVRYLEASDPRNFDWRARLAWGGANPSMAPRGGAELLMDHRREMTTANGARNEMLPPRLWMIIDPTAPSDLTRVRPAYVHRGVDFNNDGSPDDVNGDGTVNSADDVPPYDPRIVYFNATPRGDANGDGVVDLRDAELARQEFLRRNQKVDLRRPTDIPTGNGVPATNAAIAVAERNFNQDIQRLLRRALIDEDTRGSYLWNGDPGKQTKALQATKLMASSLAANIASYRDGERQVTNTLWLDGPVSPDDAVAIPSDAIPDPQYNDARFVGVEKQPYFQEVFVAFVFPKTKLTQAEIEAVTGPPGAPNSGCPDAANCQLNAGDPYELPPCTSNGAGEHFVTYDPADSSTWPAVIFVAQVANPYNAPVNLADFEIRINPDSGAPQRFFFGLPGPAGSRSGNIYGPDVELGPATPEEPRTAVVFSIPETFPNGEPFPRDSWLDFLDLGKPVTETNPSNDTKPGQFFEPDVNAIFAPAWGGPGGGSSTTYFDNNKRSGTLLFDATRTLPPLPVFAGLDVSGDLNRWRPAPSSTGNPPSSFIELRRALYRANGTPTWSVVDRLDNELNPGSQVFRDTMARLFTDEHLPPKKEIDCRSGKLAISGIRIRDNDYYVVWARGARQWLFDTQNGATGTPPGKGVITLDERTPRYAFSRLTGVDRVQETQSDVYVGDAATQRKGSIFKESDLPDGQSAGRPWTTMDYTNVWGEARRGKPTFFPTRIAENSAGPDRRYDYPAWRMNNATPPSGMTVSYGEKGVTDAKFVDGTDPDNFVAPYRFFQKDADYEQVAEILDVPLWGPLMQAGTTGGCYATLPEILAQEPDATGNLVFPKAPAGANLAYWNRLQLDVARYDTTPAANGRPNLLSGVPVVSSPVGFISPQQAGIALLDAFTVDDRGAARFDSDNDGTISFNERAAAENRRFRLAQGYQGKGTPGLVNINTAPIEVMRAMPQMTRLVYNDDDNLNGIPTIADNTNQQAVPRDFPTTPTTQFNAIGFDYGTPAPRVRVPEAIELWRNKGNVTPNLGAVIDVSQPSYFTRGLDLPDAQNNLEHAPGMRQDRGFDSLGELALMTKPANFANPANPQAGDVGNSWNQTVGWSVRYAGLDPFRTRFNDATSGAAYAAPVSAGPTAPPGGTAHRTDGVPKAGAAGTLQYYSLSGRTATDPHLLVVGTDDRNTPAVVETDNPATGGFVETTLGRWDLTAGDALEQNSLLKGISNLVTVRSDVFTVYVRVRTVKRNAITGRWDATDPDYILDESRYVMGVDRSNVDRPGEKPRILYFTKVPN